jgi:hypothetical protein
VGCRGEPQRVQMIWLSPKSLYSKTQMGKWEPGEGECGTHMSLPLQGLKNQTLCLEWGKKVSRQV